MAASFIRKNRPGSKWLTVISTLACHTLVLITKVKSFIVQVVGRKIDKLRWLDADWSMQTISHNGFNFEVKQSHVSNII